MAAAAAEPVLAAAGRRLLTDSPFRCILCTRFLEIYPLLRNARTELEVSRLLYLYSYDRNFVQLLC